MFSGEWKVETPKGFAIADAHVNLNGIDNFMININLDSDKLKHRKIHAEIANKPTAKTGRRIIITVTSDGKNIVTGRYAAAFVYRNRAELMQQFETMILRRILKLVMELMII